MGAHVGDESKAIAELAGLSKEAREYIGHHLNSALSGITANIRIARDRLARGEDATANLDRADEAAWHAAGDVREICHCFFQGVGYVGIGFKNKRG